MVSQAGQAFQTSQLTTSTSHVQLKAKYTQHKNLCCASQYTFGQFSNTDSMVSTKTGIGYGYHFSKTGQDRIVKIHYPNISDIHQLLPYIFKRQSKTAQQLSLLLQAAVVQTADKGLYLHSRRLATRFESNAANIAKELVRTLLNVIIGNQVEKTVKIIFPPCFL